MTTDAPIADQDCYNLGYDHPSKPHSLFAWKHVAQLNAYHAGQMDSQNLQPRNQTYSRSDYDPVTGERTLYHEIMKDG